MTADEQEDIFVMRVDGTERRQLTNDQHNDRSPRWSPDGRRISFYSNRTGSYEIWTIRRDGSDLVQHTDTPGQSVSYPSWSPDGSRMAYYSSTSKKSYIFDMDKTWEGQVPVTLPPFEGGQEPFTVYSWSADGRHIAGWTRSPDGSPTGIVIFDLESKQYKRLTDSGIFPVWLSDNQRLLYGDDRKILVVDMLSGQVNEILTLHHGRVGSMVSVSADDEWIYFVHVLEEADIWMLEFDPES
jgi:Tol biopolymer transport system component